MKLYLFSFISCVSGLISPIPRSKAYASCIHGFSDSWTTDEQKDFACTTQEKWHTDIDQKPTDRLHKVERDWFASLGSLDVLEPHQRQPCIRKEYRLLGDTERNRFHEAVNRLKSKKLSSGISQYDLFVKLHTAYYAPGAHGGASFFPWHREFLKRFEIALRMIDPTVCLPYWDNTLDKALENPSESVLWSTQFLGNGNGFVTSGPFAHWQTSITGGTLDRNVESSPSNLMNNGVINRLMVHQTLANISCQTNCEFEASHSAVHLFVGGKMASLVSAPEDPVFYMHHAFVDCVWDIFRQRSNVNPINDYPNSNFGSSFNHPNSPMSPFDGYKNIAGTRDYYSYYRCAPRPVCSGPNSVKGAKYILCEQTERGLTLKSALRNLETDTCDPMEVDQPQNSFCVNGKCDTDLWSFIPVSVVHVKSEPLPDKSSTFPVHNNQPSYNIDVYSGMSFSTAKNYSCSDDNSCCKRTRGVYLHAVGLNYQGSYKERVFIDPRPLIASADACVGVPNPVKYGQVKVRLRASDSCGHVCQPYCAVHDPAGIESVSYQRCSGDIAVNSRKPKMYSNSLKEVEENRWGHIDTKGQNLPMTKHAADFVIFHCNGDSLDPSISNTVDRFIPILPDFSDFGPETSTFDSPLFEPNPPVIQLVPSIKNDYPLVQPALPRPEPPIKRPDPPIVHPEPPRPEPPIVKPEPPLVHPEPPRPETAIIRPEPPIVRPEPPIVRPEPPRPEPPIIIPDLPIGRPEPPRPEPPIIIPDLPIVRPEPPRPEPPIIIPDLPIVRPEPPRPEPQMTRPETSIVRPERPFTLVEESLPEAIKELIALEPIPAVKPEITPQKYYDPYKNIRFPNQLFQMPYWPKRKSYRYSNSKQYSYHNSVTSKPSAISIFQGKNYYPISKPKNNKKYYSKTSFPGRSSMSWPSFNSFPNYFV